MRFAWLLLLALAGCGTTTSDQALYQDARRLLHSEHFQQAAAKADLGLQRAARGSAWEFKFRLLRAEILLLQREAKQAQAALQFPLPSGPQWTEDLARYRYCQGSAALLLNDDSEAESRLREALGLAASAGNPGLQAEVKLLLGALAARTGKPGEAERDFHDVLDYAVRHGDLYLQLGATGNMGFMLLRSSRFEEAIPWFDNVLTASRRLGAASSETRAMGNLGWCYYRLGDYDQAQRYAQQAAALCERIGDRSEWLRWLDNMGSIYLDQHDYLAAAATYQQALKVARVLGEPFSIAELLNNLALVSIDTRDWDNAERYNNEALEIRRQIHETKEGLFSLTNAARIAAGRRDYAHAEQIFQTVIHSPSAETPTADARAVAPTPLLDARAGLAQMFAVAHRDRDAEAEFQAALAIVDRQQAQLSEVKNKLSSLEGLIRFYQDYVEFLMARGRPRDALEVAESSRARVLADKLNRTSQRRSHTAAELQKLAGIYQSTLLSYWVAPAKSYLWVITPAGVSAFPLPPESELRDLVASYDALIQNLRDPLTAEHPAGRKLYDALIGPARQLLAKTGKVIVTPDGPLYSLNFETLPVSAPKPHYFIEDATVSVTPALTLLSRDRARGAATHSLLLIGNPVSAGERYPALKFAGQEMSAIQHSLPGFRTVALEGAQAQPQAYAAADPGRFALIHFVAHASPDRVDPLQSAVILSPHGSSYTLRASDVMKTPLQADLVTVSACRSAGARTYGGEGLVGFAWAFLEAGAHNVIAGLWDVNDRSTADLMARLYGGLARGAPPAEALRSAKLEMVRSTGAYRKPYYWGPFQVFTRSR